MISPDRENQEPKIKIGEMPTPRYMSEASNTALRSDGTPIKWIEIEAYNLNGEIKEFLWWRNFETGDLNKNIVRNKVAKFFTRIKMDRLTDTAIGLPIKLSKCNPETGFVEIDDKAGLYGIYVESEKRPYFNFNIHFEGLQSEDELRIINSKLFSESYNKIKAVLPHSKPSISSEKK